LRPSADSNGTTPAQLAITSGLIAGLVGTAALTAFEQAEGAILGRTPRYAASMIARRVLRNAGFDASPAQARHWGLAMRWLYGPTLGALFGSCARGRHLPSAWRTGILLSAAVYSFELVAMPATGATKPIRRWKWHEVALLFFHVSAFGLAAAATMKVIEADKP
jgi:hypothetical protein